MGSALQTETNIKIKLGPHPIQTQNYWTPLTKQVEVMDNIIEDIEDRNNNRQNNKDESKMVWFQLPFGEGKSTSSQKWKRKSDNRRRRKSEEKEERLKRGVLHGTIPSTVSDS